MKKTILMVAVAATVCATIVGCGKSKSESGNKTANENVTEITETVSSETEEAYVPVGEQIADRYGIKLESNQGIITVDDGKAIVMTAPEGYKFTTQYAENNVTLVSNDYSETYKIYACEDTLTKEYMNEHYDVEDYGNGCFIDADENNSVMNAFWFGEDVKLAFIYANNTDAPTDLEAVSANIKSVVETINVCK